MLFVEKIKASQRRIAILLFSFMLLVSSFMTSANICLAETILPSAENNINIKDSDAQTMQSDFSTEYSTITKEILLASIELERFSLNYRRECLKPSIYRQIRYFCAQETGAAGALTFEIIATKQFNTGRKHPLQISPADLRGAFTTSLITSIIAGSGSLLELTDNTFVAIKHCRQGYDPHTAKKYVLAKLNNIDQLLARRHDLVELHCGQPGYRRAILEGQILNELRNAFIEEFAQFHSGIRSYAAFTNTFYLANAATNALAATAAGIGYRATKKPKLNGPANILFIVTGAFALGSPILSSLVSKYVAWDAHRSVLNHIKDRQTFDIEKLNVQEKQLDALNADSNPGSLMPTLPAADRLAIYMHSGELFKKQLLQETTVIHRLNKVALESSILGPAIGGLLMTQGILGTIGYYKYTLRPRAQINHYFSGAVVGTVGASMAVLGTAGWLIASLAYDHKLKKEHRLPRQLIQERLDHLDNLEKTILSLH